MVNHRDDFEALAEASASEVTTLARRLCGLTSSLLDRAVAGTPLDPDEQRRAEHEVSDIRLEMDRLQAALDSARDSGK